MSSHREAPSISNLSAFVGLPTLAALQVGSAFALDTLGQLDVSVAKDASFELLLDSSSGIAQSTFFGSPIQLKLQKFVAS